MPRRLFLLALLLPLTACASHLRQKENLLREAGFHAVTPSTTAQIAKVGSLPPGRIHRLKHRGHVLFVLADPKQRLLLVGGNPQYEAYQQLLYKKVVEPAVEDRAFDRALEDDGGWDGLCDPFFGPMIY
jgi:hypothetical protein